MKLNSVSGFTCYVKDFGRTAKFYSTLGFLSGKRDADRMSFRVNWFSVEFILEKEKADGDKGAGVFFCLTVDDADDFYQGLLEKGLKPESEPQDRPGGKREFVLRDPDGYKLLIFSKK